MRISGVALWPRSWNAGIGRIRRACQLENDEVAGITGAPMGRTLSVEIPPEWDAIDRVRESLTIFLRDADEDDDVVHAISMVASELTENAIKYGRFGGTDLVSLDVEASSSAITIEVRHRTSTQDMTHLDKLDRIIQWIRGYQDPFEAYLARLKEVAMQRLDSGESGLGLVRVAYEGESSLDFYVSEADTLAVSATYHR